MSGLISEYNAPTLVKEKGGIELRHKMIASRPIELGEIEAVLTSISDIITATIKY